MSSRRFEEYASVVFEDHQKLMEKLRNFVKLSAVESRSSMPSYIEKLLH
jgi:hypothetical protein